MEANALKDIYVKMAYVVTREARVQPEVQKAESAVFHFYASRETFVLMESAALYQVSSGSQPCQTDAIEKNSTPC